MGRLTGSTGGRLKQASSSDVDTLVQAATKLGLDKEIAKILDTTPKLSFLQRLTKGLGSFNPAEAILTGKEEGLGAGVKKYATGIVKGIGSAITGKDIEGERRYFSDVAEELGIENKIAKFGIGFLGDVLLDPTTYFGGAIARGLTTGAKVAGKAGLGVVSKVAPEVGLATKTSLEAFQDALGATFKAGYKTTEGAVQDVLTHLNKIGKAKAGLAESNLERLGTGVLTKEQNTELFARLAGGKRLEYTLRESGEDFAGVKALQETQKGAVGVVKETLESQLARTKKFGEAVSENPYSVYFPFIRKDKLQKLIYDVDKSGLKVGSEGYKKAFRNLLTDENLEQDVAKAFFTRESQVVTDKITRDFLDGFAKKYGKELSAFKSIDEAKQAGYSLLREKGIWGKEIGYIPKWDAKFITDMLSPEFKTIDTLAKATGFDAVTSLFKRSVTGLFAPFHIRNYVSGQIQNFETLGIDALNPKNIMSGGKLALDTIKGVKMNTREMKMFSDRFKYSSFYTNEFDMAQSVGQSLDEYQKVLSGARVIKTLKTAGLSSEAIPFKIGRAVGNFIELQQKATAYVTALGQGKTIPMALELAEKAGFDYRVLTKFESQILRRIVPFYSFTRKNIGLQLRTLGENPQRINQIIRLVENAGEQPTEEERQSLPDYIKESFAIKLPDTASGLKQYLSSLGTPIEQFAGSS